jgi:hypothetical protein
MRWRFVVCMGLSSACGGYAGVPASQPHATLHIRYVHTNRELAYEDSFVLDGRSVSVRGLGARETSVRLTPGTHLLYLSSIATRYTAVDQVTERRTIEYVGSVPVPTLQRDTHSALVPSASSDCSRDLELSVAQGQQRLVLLVASGTKACFACVVDNVHAQSCAGDALPSSAEPAASR